MFRTLLFAALLLAGIGAAEANPVFPPGLRVGLEPVGTLKSGPGISGFQDRDRNVTVAIAELPVAAYAELIRAMFGTVPTGATEVERKLFPFKDGIGYLHQARTVENGAAVKHWLFLAMPAGLKQPFVVLINISVPQAASKIYSDAVMRKMLASMTIRNPPIEEQLGLIPFKITDLAGFQVRRVTPDSVLLADGAEGDPSQTAYMVVSIGRASAAQMDDPARFSRDLLAHVPVRDLTMQSAEKMRIGGTPGFEIRARGEGAGDSKLSVVQWVRFMGGSFIRMIAVTPTEQWDDTFNRFRAVRDGVELR
jgi:hypothetical protein